MSRFLASALGAAVLLGALSSVSVAGNPDPAFSTWDNLVGVSPKNLTAAVATRYRFTGTLRDGTNQPIPNFPASQVELDFTSCSEAHVGIPADLQPDADGPSNLNGQVVWTVNLTFGGNDPCEVRVLVQNIVFKTLAMHQGLPGPSIDGGVRSPDATGDAIVALGDLTIFQTEFVNTGVRRDYDGDLGPTFDGLTALGDLTTFQSHFVAP
jgi:hypothetical protein